jgi:hypothetical protein
MTNSSDWSELSHEEKMDQLQNLNIDEIIEQYRPANLSPDEFRQQLLADMDFWKPQNIQEFEKGGGPPTKETAIGAWRDLSRAEAILELIDNSIDAWMRRRERYPNKTAPTLLIYIDADVDSGILTYEDNAGGVGQDKLDHLIVPGYSETSDTEWTIGSYRTGGKKAIFKLAQDARIWTRYWNPVGTSDEAYEIHLDKKWLRDPIEYRYVYGILKDKAAYEKGQTVYRFRLHESSANWDVDVIREVTSEIRRNYTLLLIRNPNIEIYFMDRENPLEPLEDMYKFTGAYDKAKGLDLRPQRAQFTTKVEYRGQKHDVTIEVVLGCRMTAGIPEGEGGFGIDLYGNNRLFVYREYELFRNWYRLPGSGAKNLVRGYINVLGPNVLIPWDTHKRHLNPEREVVQILRHNPQIRQLFDQWRSAYLTLASSQAIKRTISKPLTPFKKGNDLYVPHSNKVSIVSWRRRGTKLPKTVHTPLVPDPKPPEKQIELKLKFSQAEFKVLCKEYGLDHKEEKDAKRRLSQIVKENALSQLSY